MSEQQQPPKAEVKERAVSTVSRTTGLVPSNLGEAMDIAKLLAASNAIPKEFMGNPSNIMLAVMHGHAVGLSPAQALSSMMVVNNRVSIWGDALIGVVKASPEYEWSKDGYDASVENGTAWFEVKRRGEEPLRRTFSMDDAKKAGLLGKAGPWQNYPKRMLLMRARAFALRDCFPDILKGLRVVEEERDVIETTATPGHPVKAPAAEARGEVVEGFPSELTPAEQARAEASEPASKPKTMGDAVREAEVVDAKSKTETKPDPEPAPPAPAAKPKGRRF